MLQVKKVLGAAVTDHTLVGSEADISAIVSRIMELARPFDSDRSGGYSVGEFCSHAGDDGTVRLYQCTVNHSQGEAWSDEHFAERDVSALFSISNTANDAANINYTVTGETATTVKAKIQGIETLVGTANADLEDALSGTDESALT